MTRMGEEALRETLLAQQEKCAHLWTYMGVRFRDGKYVVYHGSEARARYYAQAYLCQKCALTRVDRLRNFDSDTSQPLQFGATPATAEEFPIEDEKGAEKDGS